MHNLRDKYLKFCVGLLQYTFGLGTEDAPYLFNYSRSPFVLAPFLALAKLTLGVPTW